MGQRSQIYIIDSRIDNGMNGNPALVEALHDQWNYGERMISRTRGIIEEITDNPYWYLRSNDSGKTNVGRIAAVNFDLKGVHDQGDLIIEWADYWQEDGTRLNKDFFTHQDNNDGVLFINVTDDGIRYALTDGACEKVMDADQYMEWDLNDGKRYPDWRTMMTADNFYKAKDWREKTSEELAEMNRRHVEEGIFTIGYTEPNIEYIKEHAELMTQDEFNAIVNHDYTDTVVPDDHRGWKENGLLQKIAELEKLLAETKAS